MEYLYIGFLGGSRFGKTLRNLLVTMILGGMWHGGTVSYLLWGVYHGTCLVLERKFNRSHGSVTFIAVTLGWLFFIYPSIDDFRFFLENLNKLGINLEVLPVLPYLFASMLIAFVKPINRLVNEPNWSLLVLMVILIYLNPGIKNDFIYFQF